MHWRHLVLFFLFIRENLLQKPETLAEQRTDPRREEWGPQEEAPALSQKSLHTPKPRTSSHTRGRHEPVGKEGGEEREGGSWADLCLLASTILMKQEASVDGSEVVLKKVRPEQPGKEESLVSAESEHPHPAGLLIWEFGALYPSMPGLSWILIHSDGPCSWFCTLSPSWQPFSQYRSVARLIICRVIRSIFLLCTPTPIPQFSTKPHHMALRLIGLQGLWDRNQVPFFDT